LKQVVRHHVAQRAGGVVKAAAMADAKLLVDGDLDVIDVVAVPDRLEHALAKRSTGCSGRFSLPR